MFCVRVSPTSAPYQEAHSNLNLEAKSETLQKRLLTHEGREPFELVRRSKPPCSEATRSTLPLERERTASPRLKRSPVPITTARPLMSERMLFSLFVILFSFTVNRVTYFPDNTRTIVSYDGMPFVMVGFKV